MSAQHDSKPAMTLQGLLEASGAEVVAYDLGRRVGRLTDATFRAFEAATTPYPLPMQRKAWFALVQRTGSDPGQPVIWFLRLSLDEQGLLIPAERDYLLNRLLESAQARQRGGDPEDFLRDNPYTFSPREDRMALFHACVSADLGLPPSRFYDHALDYFRGAPGWDQWGFVGYQGIADVACRHTDEPLTAAIAQLPAEPLVALCHCLESRQPGTALQAALLDRLDLALQAPHADIGVLAALVRGLAGGARSAPVRVGFAALLESAHGSNIEILAALSGRAWEALEDDTLRNRYLHCLAANDHGQEVFTHCINDLLSLPALAGPLRQSLRADDQADNVRAAFAAMLGQADAPPL